MLLRYVFALVSIAWLQYSHTTNNTVVYVHVMEKKKITLSSSSYILDNKIHLFINKINFSIDKIKYIGNGMNEWRIVDSNTI